MMRLSNNIGTRASLIVLYAATFLMRSSAYISIAVITSSKYQQIGVSNLTIGLIVAAYPATEILTVMFFGVLCDRTGRKPILVFAHFVTAISAFLFALTRQTIFLAGIAALFGIGAASKVSSTLTMVADSSSIKNRAQLMGIFDITTLGGLVGGYIAGVFLLNVYHWAPKDCFLLAGSLVLLSAIMVLIFVEETVHKKEKRDVKKLVEAVFKNKDVHRLLPVYIPVMCLYGLLITFVERFAEEANLSDPQLQLVLGAIGLSLIISIILNGKLSDRLKLRRPFIFVGLVCFGALVSILTQYKDSLEELWRLWPVLILLAFGGGAFPPAILAYVTDITKQESRGTTFGLYSVILGSGMIIGPISGGIVVDAFGIFGFIVLVIVFVEIAAINTLYLPERIREVE